MEIVKSDYVPKTTGEYCEKPELLDKMIDFKTNNFLDKNWLRLLARDYPTIPAMYFVNFVHLCQLYGANPIKKEIYLIPFFKSVKNSIGQWEKVLTANIVFSYTFFLDRAASHHDYDGFTLDQGIDDYFMPDKGEICKMPFATCSVYSKSRPNRPTKYTAWYPEFVQTNDGKPTGQWKKYYLMLGKCAISNAMRWAFPDKMAGMYNDEEMPPVIETTAVKNEFKKETHIDYVEERPKQLTDIKAKPDIDEYCQLIFDYIQYLAGDGIDRKNNLDNLLNELGVTCAKEILKLDVKQKIYLESILKLRVLEKNKALT